MKALKLMGTIAAVIGVAIVVRAWFPVRVVQPPRIRLQIDTVATIDTVRLTEEIIRTTRPDTVWLERLTVTPPETVMVVPPLAGLTALIVAPRVGDSSVAQGFRVVPADSGYAFTRWEAQWYTPGPLRSLVIDGGLPRAAFGPPPPRACGPWCKLGHYVTGGAVVGGATAIACAVTR